jgi:putative lipoprotein
VKKKMGVAVALGASLLSMGPRASAQDPDPWLGRDKAYHFGASAAVAAGTYALTASHFNARWQPLVLAGGLAVGIGAGKELLDMAGMGDPSWKDFTWDVLGTIAGLALAWGADLLIGGVDSSKPALGQANTGIAIRF